MDVGPFLGALLGFFAGLSVDRVVTWWRRRERSSLYRNLITEEVLYNLPVMEEIRKTAQDTLQTKIRKRVIEQPRLQVLRSLATASEALLGLTHWEQRYIVENVGRLEYLAGAQATCWDVATGPQADTLFRGPDGKGRPHWELMTESLIDTASLVAASHVFLLLAVLNESHESRLFEESWRRLRGKFAPTRRRWFRKPMPFNHWSWSSDMGRLMVPTGDDSHLLIVWSHDEPHYPGPIVDIKATLDEVKTEQELDDAP